MKLLFVGGTGNISTSCTRVALERGHEVWHLNRGNRTDQAPDGARTITADIRDAASARKALDGREFDCVVDWIAFVPEHLQFQVDLWSGRAGQFVFISSASVYHKPPSDYRITESTPAYNPFWRYSQNKIACEEYLWQEYRSRGFPATVVRPSHTYSDGWFPTSFGSADFTVPARILDGRPIVVHGDGQSLWTITHSDDFAKGFLGLLGNPAAIGETFHITSDEALTWDQIHRTIGRALGRAPSIVHVASEAIAREDPEFGAGLLGDKQYSVVFDNTKIKRYVPGYHATIPFYEGMERSARLMQDHPELQVTNQQHDQLIERLLSMYAGPDD